MISKFLLNDFFNFTYYILLNVIVNVKLNIIKASILLLGQQ